MDGTEQVHSPWFHDHHQIPRGFANVQNSYTLMCKPVGPERVDRYNFCLHKPDCIMVYEQSSLTKLGVLGSSAGPLSELRNLGLVIYSYVPDEAANDRMCPSQLLMTKWN